MILELKITFGNSDEKIARQRQKTKSLLNRVQQFLKIPARTMHLVKLSLDIYDTDILSVIASVSEAIHGICL